MECVAQYLFSCSSVTCHISTLQTFQAGAIALPFAHCILDTPAYLTHSPQHDHSAPAALCCQCPPSSRRCWPGCWTFASSATRSSPRAIVGLDCGGGGLAAAGTRRATGSSRSPRRGRHPGTCGRSYSQVSKSVVDVHGPRCSLERGSQAPLRGAKTCKDALQTRPDAAVAREEIVLVLAFQQCHASYRRARTYR